MLLSPSELIAFAREVAALLGTHCRTLLDEDQDGAVRIVDDAGRALVLYQETEKPQRLCLWARLPQAAEASGFTVRPVTVAAGCAPAHAAAHIRRRLLPAHAQALDAFLARTTAPGDRLADGGSGTDAATLPAPTDVQQQAANALATVAPPFAMVAGTGWIMGEQTSRRRPLPAVWWHSSARDAEGAEVHQRSMAPFLADALRRAGLHTTEPWCGRWVFFAPPPPLPGPVRYVATRSLRRKGGVGCGGPQHRGESAWLWG